MSDHPTTISVTAKERFLNRELSWLAFNRRVLDEAWSARHPLLERVRFLGIAAANMDEFFTVRVAGLKAQVAAGVETLSPEGLTPADQLQQVLETSSRIMEDQYRCWKHLKGVLAADGIAFARTETLTAAERTHLESLFHTDLFSLLTPIALDPTHPFPFIPNTGRAIVLTLIRDADDTPLNALIPLPARIPRFVRTCAEGCRFVLSDQVILLFAHHLFPGCRIDHAGFVRVLRDSELGIDEEAEDLVRTFETAIKRRRRGDVVRVSMNDTMPQDLLDLLVQDLRVDPSLVYLREGVLGLDDVQTLTAFATRPDQLFPPYDARFPERIREHDGDCFAAIRAKDFVVHHPYESFDVVVQFLQQAARDPEVLAIKQTLYRVGNDSPIVKALIEAAEQGKAVVAMVELKARFDEEANLRWARDLERAGAQVVFGFVKLKIHAKLSMVVRRETDGLRTYTHFGTGNYHAATARVYTDLSFFTCDPAMAADATALFNYMTGTARPLPMQHLVYAPVTLRQTLTTLIQAEMAAAQAGQPAHIWIKCNAVTDPEMIDLLYAASHAGVQVDMVVRGICCLRPGVPGLSETIRVKSIIGRFLEHARIYCFANGVALPSKAAHVFLSSADLMTRNLDWRVESLIPLRNGTVRQQVMDQIMVANLNDTRFSWQMQPDGTYHRMETDDTATGFSAHHYFMTNPSLSGRGSARLTDAPEKLGRA